MIAGVVRRPVRPARGEGGLQNAKLVAQGVGRVGSAA